MALDITARNMDPKRGVVFTLVCKAMDYAVALRLGDGIAIYKQISLCLSELAWTHTFHGHLSGLANQVYCRS